MIASFALMIALYCIVKANTFLDNTNSNVEALQLFFFYLFILTAYFLIFVALYQSIRAIIYAFTKGSFTNKVLASLSLYNTISPVYYIMSYYLSLDKISEAVIASFHS